ncbi:hypothetical protein F5Y07DRAFT_404391 [Xylaria sp. FL0933]|nr:hypothetical protein F5Y07DRAFT_404391 [Xylaria sp. FL0933]
MVSDAGGPAGRSTALPGPSTTSMDPFIAPSSVAIPTPSVTLERSNLTEFFDPPELRFPSPTRRDILVKNIYIRHPGYPKAPALAVFAASDEGGIHYNMVYYACCIIACNVWHADEGRSLDKETPFLSETSALNPIEVPRDNILQTPYPVTPNFDNWKFPPAIPVPWSSLEVPTFAELSTPDVSRVTHVESCRVTRSLVPVEQSHIIPRAAVDWFYDNRMANYMTCPTAGQELDDFSNIIPLRADVHRLFDASNICFFPKPDPAAENKFKLLTCVLRPPHKSCYGDLELYALYHNRQVLPLKGALPQYLFARFAWAIFNDDTVRLFRQKRRKYYVEVLEKVKNGENKWTKKMSFPSHFPQLRSEASAAAAAGQKRTWDQACGNAESVEADEEWYRSDDSDEY